MYSFICDMAWIILDQRVLYKLALLTLNMLNSLQYMLSFCFNISSDIRSMKIYRGEKVVGQKLGEHGLQSLRNSTIG